MNSGIKSIGLVIRTVCHLKPIQVVYQLKNRLIKPKHLQAYSQGPSNILYLDFFLLPPSPKILKSDGEYFTINFLNLSKSFRKSIDWNFQDFGKLWNYNLQYLDFLRQENLPVQTAEDLLRDIYTHLWYGKLPLEPYPSSLRIMNVIRFLSKNKDKFKDKDFLISRLHAEVSYLAGNLEYHLMGNHLLENGFALLMGGVFFRNLGWSKKAEGLLERELKEQILSDGAHFELSPMYHQIVLFRILEANYYLREFDFAQRILKPQAEKMLSWLKNITFRNGDVPHFNDSVAGIAFNSSQLLDMAKNIPNLEKLPHLQFGESGYRKMEIQDLEMIFDINGIAPVYQPGHAHADTFSFCLNYQNQPIVVDSSISTYEIGKRRTWERSTNAHNTLEIEGISSSEVWAGFRVGRRARVNIEVDLPHFVQSSHDGYQKIGLIVQRTFSRVGNTLIIKDKIVGNRKLLDVRLYLHLHPQTLTKVFDDRNLKINESIQLQFSENMVFELEDYDFPMGYNRLVKSKRVAIRMMGDSSEIIIKILK